MAIEGGFGIYKDLIGGTKIKIKKNLFEKQMERLSRRKNAIY